MIAIQLWAKLEILECYLVKTGTDEPIEYFQSVLAAAQYASENLGCSLSGMKES